LGKADESDEIFEQHQEQEPEAERPWPRSGQMVRGFIIQGAPRFEESHQSSDDAKKRRDALNCKKTKDEHVEQHRRRAVVAADDTATMIFWTKLFLEVQGYDKVPQ
jgi:hypothetical protein